MKRMKKITSTSMVLLAVLCSCSWIVDVDQKVEPTSRVEELRRITDQRAVEFFPVPSSDAGTILVSVKDADKNEYDGWSIFSVNINDPSRQIVAGPGSLDPTWSSEGNSIIYSYVKSGNSRLVKSGKGTSIS